MGLGGKVAIIGTGTIKFGENFHQSLTDMIYEAVTLALADAGIERGRLQAAWLRWYRPLPSGRGRVRVGPRGGAREYAGGAVPRVAGGAGREPRAPGARQGAHGARHVRAGGLALLQGVRRERGRPGGRGGEEPLPRLAEPEGAFPEREPAGGARH